MTAVTVLFLASCKKEELKQVNEPKSGDILPQKNRNFFEQMKFFKSWHQQEIEIHKYLAQSVNIKDSLTTVLWYVSNMGDGGGGGFSPNFAGSEYVSFSQEQKHAEAWGDTMPILCGNFSAFFQSTIYALGLPWKSTLYNHGYNDANLTHVNLLITTSAGIFCADGMFGHIFVDQFKKPLDFFTLISSLKHRKNPSDKVVVSFMQDCPLIFEDSSYIMNLQIGNLFLVEEIYKLLGPENYVGPKLIKSNSTKYPWKIKMQQTMEKWVTVPPSDTLGGKAYIKRLEQEGFDNINYLLIKPINTIQTPYSDPIWDQKIIDSVFTVLNN